MQRKQACPVDLFNLPGWTIQTIDTEQAGSRCRITIMTDTEATSCPFCETTLLPYRYGCREKLLLDLPIHMKPVHLLALRRRYQCRACGKTFLDDLPHIDTRYAATTRLVEYIQVAALHPKRTFTSLAQDLGVSETFVRSIFLDHIETRERTYEIVTPRYLGVDEIVLSAPRFVAADLERHCLIDMLEKRTLEVVSAWLQCLPRSETVEVLVMDMWKPYRMGAVEKLPHAQVVIDRFHVVRRFHEVAEPIRRTIRADLPIDQRKQLKHDYALLLKRDRDLSEQQRLIVESWIGLCPPTGCATR